MSKQFTNTAPLIDSATITPSSLKIGETANTGVIASDKENDNITVTIAVYKPDATWNNATATPVGGYWMREFTADLNGTHRIYAVATDSCGATTSLLIGTVQATTPPVVPNTPPSISSISIPAYKVTEGQTVFITIAGDDTEDGGPAATNVSLTAPNGATYNYMFANTRFANVVLNTTGMPTGVYNVHVVLQDSQGAKTSATVGSFQIEHAAEAKPVANEFLVEELGLGIISLVVLVVIALLVWKRVTHTATPASPPAS